MSTIDITQVSKLKHAALHKAAKKLGGQSALARHIGVAPSELGEWCNLKRTPPKSWTTERIAEVEKKLFDLTGQTWEEIFPQELCEAEEFLKASKTMERTQSFDTTGLLSYADQQASRLTTNDPQETCITEEMKSMLSRAIATLSYREREIIKLRYGLGGGESYTLEEVGHIFKVTKDRIRQIEQKALWKLQMPSRLKLLKAFAPDRTEKLDCYEPPKDVWPSEIYSETTLTP